MVDVAAIRQRFSAVAPFLNERGRRVVAAAEASAAGYGGIAAVSAATGLAASTVGRGLRELSAPRGIGPVTAPGWWPQDGGGAGCDVAERPRRLGRANLSRQIRSRRCVGRARASGGWPGKELQAQGHQRVGRTLVSTLLDSMGYSLQGNRKTREGDSHPDRNRRSSNTSTARWARRWPSVSR